MIRKVVLVCTGALALLCSAGVGVLALTIHSAFGSDGRMELTLGSVDSGNVHALVMDIDRFSAAVPYLNSLGHTQLVVSAPTTTFVGIAGTQDVDNLLRGTTYSVATHQANDWMTTEVPGSAGALTIQTLAAQQVWLTAGQGSTVELAVPQSRPITMVIASPDALETVTVGAVFTLSHSTLIVNLGGIVAALLAVTGIVLVILGLRRPTHRGDHAPDVSAVTTHEG